MNVDKILVVADAIEQHAIPDLGFNMGVVYSNPFSDESISDMSGHNCDTVACVAGWTIELFDGSGMNKRLGGSSVMAKARDILGLSSGVSAELFTPPGYHRNIHTAADAVRTLRRLATTGRVVWSETDEAA